LRERGGGKQGCDSYQMNNVGPVEWLRHISS
jgi:hypothetical protein